MKPSSPPSGSHVTRPAVVDDASELIGRTPLVRLARLSPPDGATVYAKLESQNPGGSIKDRPAYAMIVAAEKGGQIRAGATIIEATSGNTGISLAMIAAARGYRCVLVMPEDMSLERRYVLRAYGAEIELTPGTEGMAGAVERARELTRATPNSFMPRQFENEENPKSHEQTTALEIWEQTDGELDAFVAGVGTGGTITGVGRVLKQKGGDRIQIVAVEPAASAVLSGAPAGMHGIQGLGAGFIPAILDRKLFSRIITVADVAAERMARRLAREAGLLVGPSSGANVHAAIEVAKKLKGGKVVTILCDSGERYLF
jgi:cysteine synthase A